MSTVTTKDGPQIYYRDWGKGPFVTFSHGWPLNSDAGDGQMLFLVQHDYRYVAVDRRGHGRSSQPSTANNMDGYADDLAADRSAGPQRRLARGPLNRGWGRGALHWMARYEAGRQGRPPAVPPIILPIEVFDKLGLTSD